jgi:hypothetical protein
METSFVIEDSNVKEIPSLDIKYLGCLWDDNIFRKLVISCDRTELIVNEVTNVYVQWVDIDSNPINYGENVELQCGEITEQVVIVSGRGMTTFESAEPGEFELVAISPHGVTTSVKVVVS